jgi:hypothetical protein
VASNQNDTVQSKRLPGFYVRNVRTGGIHSKRHETRAAAEAAAEKARTAKRGMANPIFTVEEVL